MAGRARHGQHQRPRRRRQEAGLDGRAVYAMSGALNLLSMGPHDREDLGQLPQLPHWDVVVVHHDQYADRGGYGGDAPDRGQEGWSF
jgi:hypothetical protein